MECIGGRDKERRILIVDINKRICPRKRLEKYIYLFCFIYADCVASSYVEKSPYSIQFLDYGWRCIYNASIISS